MRGLLGLYWNARQQSLDDCTASCLSTLNAMRENGLDDFYIPGRSRKAALRRTIDVSSTGVRKILQRNRHRRDVNHDDVIEELGFYLSAWSPRGDEEAFGLSIHCGSYSKWVGNNVTITLPDAGPYSRLFDLLVIVWRPEQGILTDSKIRWEEGIIPSDIPAFKRYP